MILHSNTHTRIKSASPVDALNAARIMARALAEATPDNERLFLARAFCYRLVASWWSVVSDDDTDFPLRPFLEPIALPTQLPEPALASADSIGHAAAAFDPETAAYAIGLTYTGMLPPALRSSLGSFYTPPQLTARLIDQATFAGVDWKTARILDPACGGGAFLTPVARRILDALPRVTPAILVQNIGSRLRGYEIDPFAAWLSQVTLDAVMLPVCRKAKRRLPVVVTVCDSLQRSATDSDLSDLVIGNPPYGRIKLAAEDRARYRRSLFGHANLYGLFTDLALAHVRPGGVVAYVTPTSFLAGEYFKNLRALLGTEAHPVTADFIALRRGVFEDVLQETLLATYKRGEGKTTAQVFEVMTDKAGAAQAVAAGRFTLPEDPSQPWLMPRSPAQATLVDRLRAMPHRLSDWGYAVSTGPLVWNRFKSQLRATPTRGSFPLIWAESVTFDGRFAFKAERNNHQPYFAPVSVADDWLITREPCVLLQRTTSKEQSRRLIATALPADFLKKHKAVVIENHLNMIRPTVAKPPVSPEVVASFLNSAAADRAFRCVSGSVAVSAYELEAIPLPSAKALKSIATLLEKRASSAQIEAAWDRLYARVEAD